MGLEVECLKEQQLKGFQGQIWTANDVGVFRQDAV
jgi:hypothetical protein